MQSCNLSRANLSNSSLYGIDLSNSNLFKANLNDHKQVKKIIPFAFNKMGGLDC